MERSGFRVMVCGASAAVGLAASQALAASGTWNVDGSATWDVSNTAPWLGGTVAQGADQTAFFDQVDITAARTVTLSSPLTIGYLSFADATTANNDWTLSGSTLTLQNTSATPTTTVTNRTAKINTILAGTQGLTKLGVGTLELNSANTYSGTTTVSAGTLNVYNSSALGSSNVSIASTATLGVQNTSVTLANAIAGSGTIMKGNSSSTVKLTNNNASFTGTLQLQDGTLLLSTATNGGLGAGSLKIGFAGTIASDDSTSRSISNVINLNNASGSLNFGTATGTGDLTFTDSTTGNTLNGTTKLTVRNSTTVTLNKQFNSGQIHKWGTGKLVLAGTTLSYSGATTVNSGTLLINGSKTGTGAVTVNADFGTAGNDSLPATLGGTGSIVGTLTVMNGGILAPGASIGTLQVRNTTINSNGTLAIELGSGTSDLLAVTGNLTLDSGALLNLSGTADGVTNYVIASYTGALSGNFGTPTLPLGYSIDYGTGSNSQITLVVPEPASLALLGITTLAVTRRRRV